MKYKGFLSYKHGDDDALAISLEKSLEKFAKPTFKRRALEIFRDSNALSAAADLGEKIRNGLQNSDYFICLANPAYAQSKWCCREAEYWRDHKSKDNLLILLTDGEILWDESTNDFDWNVTTALPKELSGVFTGEPFYIDFRNAGPTEKLNLDNPDFKTRLVLLAATLHDKTVGDMVGEAVKQHKRTLRFRNAAVAIVMALMALTIVLTTISNRRKSASLLHFQAKSTEATNPTLALRLEEEALKIYDYPEFKRSAFEIMNRNAFYRIIQANDTAHFTAMDMSKQKTILLAGTDGIISLIDQDGNLVRKFNLEKGSINAAKFAPDGMSFITSSNQGTHLWNLEGSLLAEFKEDTIEDTKYSATAFDFAPDGKTVLTGSYSGAYLWDLNGQRIPGFEIKPSVKSVAFAPEGNAVLIGYDGAKTAAGLFDLEGNYKATFSTNDPNYGEPHTITNTVAFSEDGQTILIGSNVNNIQLFTAKGDKVSSFDLPFIANFEEGYWTAAISADGTKILTSSFENIGQLWDRQGELIKEFKGHDAMIHLFAFDPTDEMMIYTGSRDRTIRKWYMEGLNASVTKRFSVQTQPIYSIDIAPDNESFVTSTGNSSAYLWDFEENLLKEFKHNSKVTRAIFSPNSKSILTETTNGVHLWNLQGDLRQEQLITDDILASAAFSLDGKSILFSSKTKPENYRPGYITNTSKWDLNNNTLKSIELGAKEATYANFSYDGKAVITVSKDGAQLWNMAGDSIHTFTLPEEQVNPVAISPDGTRVLTYPSPKTTSHPKYGKTHLWNLQGELIQEFKLIGQSVDPKAFFPDGNAILTLSYPELSPYPWGKGSPTARVWNLEGYILLEIHEPEKYISAMAISANGKFIMVGYMNSYFPKFGEVEQYNLVYYETIGMNDFLDAYVAPLSTQHQKEFDVD